MASTSPCPFPFTSSTAHPRPGQEVGSLYSDCNKSSPTSTHQSTEFQDTLRGLSSSPLRETSRYRTVSQDSHADPRIEALQNTVQKLEEEIRSLSVSRYTRGRRKRRPGELVLVACFSLDLLGPRRRVRRPFSQKAFCASNAGRTVDEGVIPQTASGT